MERLSATIAATSSDATKGAVLLTIWVMGYDGGLGVKLGVIEVENIPGCASLNNQPQISHNVSAV
jgi:hypothetical protein